MSLVESRNVVDIPFMAEATGLSRKLLAKWAGRRFPALDTRVNYGRVYDWTVVRPALADLVDGRTDIEYRSVDEWPT